MFKDCKELRKVSFINVKNLTEISENAFKGCTRLEEIVLPKIDDQFTIKVHAFSGCTSLKEINSEPGQTNITKSIRSPIIKLPNSCTIIEESAFENYTSIVEIKLLDKLVSIRDKAFENCTSIVEIKLPDQLVSIGDKAFKNCTSLQVIDFYNIDRMIPRKVGTNIFLNCNNFLVKNF